MTPQPPDDPRTGVPGPTARDQPDFAALVDCVEGRLATEDRQQVQRQLAHADRTTTRALSWIRSFHQAAHRYTELQPPARVRAALRRSYDAWWAEHMRAASAFDEFDWDEQAARLIFDSRRMVNLVGVRGTASAEMVQLAYALGDVDVVIDLTHHDDGTVRVDGQVLATESHPAVTPLGVALRGPDEDSRTAVLDQLGRFAFDRVLGPELEVLVRAGRRRWRLPLSPYRNH